MDKSEIKNALKDTALARPMDRANMANDTATLRALAGALNNPRAEAIERLDSFKADTTKYSGPTGSANMTIPIEQIPDESALPQRAQAPPPAAVQPLTQRAASISNKLVFTGRLISETLAEIGAKGFAADAGVRQLARFFFPLGDKVLPGEQSFTDTLRAWGTGEVTQAFPINASRATFVTMIHSLATLKQLPEGFDWTKFGRDEGFWIDSIVKQANAFLAENPEARIVFLGVNSIPELKYFQGIGCTHWHISGPAGGAPVDEFSNRLDQDVIKQISQKRNGPKLRCIWRSTTGAASPSDRLWTSLEFERACDYQEAKNGEPMVSLE
jgi:hypothetical protein